jgi:hypothetical protein
MARHSFFGDLASFVYTVGASNVLSAGGGVTVTCWSARTGGTQYTDLATDAAGTGSPLTLTSSTGTGGYPVGAIPLTYGPDGIVSMWVSANSGPRQMVIANDMLLTNTASTSVANTWTKTQTLGPLTDVNAGRLILYAEATGQVADVMTAYSGTDTGEGAARQRTFYLNEKGELRVICAKGNSVGVRIKGQPTQSVHVLEQTDTSNNPISWWEANGSWRAPNLGHTFAFSLAGTLAVQTGTHRIYNDTGVPLTIRSIRASVGTAPSGAAIRVDVNKGGTTIFTTQNNRPSIAIGTNTSGKFTSMDITALNDGEYLTADVDVIGSGTPGSDLVVQILAY